MSNIINIENMFVVEAETEILKNINLKITSGEVIIIQGISGSGKSTLLKSILFFKKIFSGSISYNGEIINENNINKYRMNFSYISQKLPYYYGIVEEFLYLPLSYKNNSNLNISRDKIEQYFDALKLNINLLKKQYNKLSDGEKQRICIIQSLFLERKFMLFDEATSNLDRESKQRVVELIITKLKKTIIAVTHDFCWDDYYTRKIIIENGEIIKDERI